MADEKKVNKDMADVHTDKENEAVVEESSAQGTVFSADYDGELGNIKVAQRTKDSKSPKKKVLLIIIAAVAVIGILVGVYCLVNSMPSADDTTATYPTDENGEQYAVDLKGNKIPSEKDGNGNILSAGVEELITQVPAAISTIDVENESGTFTVKSETSTVQATTAAGEEATATAGTTYTLVGFEDADLKSGQADAIANDAAAVTTTKIVDINGESPEDYGLSKPRATVTVTFTSGEKDIIRVGNDVTGDEGTYIQVNDDKAIYLVDSESVDSFFYSPLSLLNTEITSPSSSDDTNTPTSFTISGTNFPQPLVFVPNDDGTNTAYYKMTSPKERPANVATGSKVIGSVLSLTAEAVVCYHPSEEQMNSFGVGDPYAQVAAVYPDVEYTLAASAPNSNNLVYVYNKDKNVIYSISADKVPWVTTSYDEMVYEYVLKPNKDSLSSIEVTADGKTYTFNMETVSSTDSEGNDNSTLVTRYGDTELNESYFDTYFQNVISATREGTYDGSAASDATLTIKFTYNVSGKAAETITYYKGDSRKYLESYNGDADSFVYDTYVEKIISDTKTISENKRVDAF